MFIPLKMHCERSVGVGLVLILILVMTVPDAGGQTPLPHLRTQGTATQFIVDGEPFLMVGGELGNSSASSAEYLRPHWQKVVELNMNTVIAPCDAGMLDARHGE